PEGSTCLAGACAEWTIDSSTLPTYDDGALFGARCFDTLGCLAMRVPAALDRASCSIAAPPVDRSRINVAIETADGHGVCGADGRCFVTLDSDNDRGWKLDGSRILLPAGYCGPSQDTPFDRIRTV